jgi:5-methylcytosine-specific restriction endonuclease McrA
MSGPVNISKVERLRARDGGRCWLCEKPINFKAEPNSERAPSIEHLIPKCRDGSNEMENLVLCHPPCNGRLDNLPLVEKIKLRDQLRDEARRKKWLTDLRKRILPHLAG